MRRLLSFLCVVAVGAAACTSPEHVNLSEDDSATRIEVDSGARIEVRLESNMTTGYEWVIDEASLPEAVIMTEERFEEPDSDLVGAPGTHVFAFEAVEKGAGVLRLEYIRPFEDPPIPDKVVEYVVIVGRAAWPPEDGTPPGTSTATAP